MADVLVPTLSGRGWLTQTREKADQILSWFFVSDQSQSELFRGNVTSLAYLVHQYGHDKSLLTSQVESALSTYFRRYLPNTLVQVQSSFLNTEIQDGPYRLSILLLGQDENGQPINLADEFDVINSTFRRVMQGVNSGI